MTVSADRLFQRALPRPLAAASFAARHLGVLGWLGTILLAGALLYALVIVPQRQVESAALERQIAQLQAERVTSTKQAGSEVGAPSAGMLMPAAKEVPQIILALEALARQEGLDIKRSDYRYVESPTASVRSSAGKAVAPPVSELLEVRITTPASGDYVSLRAFLSRALEELPTLALDDLVLKRESIASGTLQTQLRFTLFVRNSR